MEVPIGIGSTVCCNQQLCLIKYGALIGASLICTGQLLNWEVIGAALNALSSAWSASWFYGSSDAYGFPDIRLPVPDERLLLLFSSYFQVQLPHHMQLPLFL